MTKKLITLPIIPKWLAVYIDEINNDDVYSGDPAFDKFEKVLSNLHFGISTYENSKAVVDKYQHVNSLKELINRMNWIEEHRDLTIIAIKYGYEVEYES